MLNMREHKRETNSTNISKRSLVFGEKIQYVLKQSHSYALGVENAIAPTFHSRPKCLCLYFAYKVTGNWLWKKNIIEDANSMNRKQIALLCRPLKVHEWIFHIIYNVMLFVVAHIILSNMDWPAYRTCMIFAVSCSCIGTYYIAEAILLFGTRYVAFELFLSRKGFEG